MSKVFETYPEKTGWLVGTLQSMLISMEAWGSTYSPESMTPERVTALMDELQAKAQDALVAVGRPRWEPMS